MSAHGLAVLDVPVLQADLNYMVPMPERPRNYTYDPPPGIPATNAKHAPHRVAIRDIRAVDAAPTLDREGFTFLVRPTALDSFESEDAIRSAYYAESIRIIAAATGADRVHIFDHTIRRRSAGASDRAAGQPRQPVPRVHVDHTERSGPQRVRDLLPEDAEHLLQGRVQIINLWRPIRGPVRDMPLAVCDASSTAPEDFVPSDLVYRDRVGETYQVTFNPAHRWYYVPRMQPDELLLIKCYDSLRDGRARFTPHAAFVDPTATGDVPPRESIEIRALVFHAA